MLIVDGGSLRIDEVVKVARHGGGAALAESVRERMSPARAAINRLSDEDAVVYGITTGFGALADRAVDPADRRALQRGVVLSHAAGMGPAPMAQRRSGRGRAYHQRWC